MGLKHVIFNNMCEETFKNNFNNDTVDGLFFVVAVLHAQSLKASGKKYIKLECVVTLSFAVSYFYMFCYLSEATV